MHIISGMVLAALMGRSKRKSELQGIPSQNTGPLRVAHVMPGRIRLIAPVLKDKDERAFAGVDQLRTLNEIDRVDVSTITGSLLIRFNQEKIDPPFLYGVVAQLLGLEEQIEQPVKALLIREINELGSSLNRAVYDETKGILDLRVLAISALLLLGGRKILQEKGAALPTGVTLIWWAFNLLTEKRGLHG